MTPQQRRTTAPQRAERDDKSPQPPPAPHGSPDPQRGGGANPNPTPRKDARRHRAI